ncbi:hypothetical protein DPMN_168191 [Dreissena polymorpha]|uniref:Uncharacterized protein n=1 Tax=Dreissena polymorpha TaxID=45954 RepID=A0A9D4F1I2_DREPO|nr:hypothetical protein DPMN_168191 [Dreissena polymorpha]
MNVDEDTEEDFTNLAECSETRPGHRAKKNSAVTCQKWSSDEEKEIRQLFEKYFVENRRPTPKQCLKAMQISKKKGGVIHLRKKDVLKRKKCTE